MKKNSIKKTLHISKVIVAKFTAQPAMGIRSGEAQTKNLTCYVCDPTTIIV